MTMQKRHIGILALLVTTMLWGTSFVILKTTLDDIPTLWVLAIRFAGAAGLMALFGMRNLRRLDRAYWRGGARMGVCLALAYIIQTYGLVYTTPGKNAFLTETYCVLVPFLWWAIRRTRPDRCHIVAAVICLLGIGLVSLRGDLTLGLGDAITLGCGLFFGLHIIATSDAVEGRDPMLLSLIQFLVAAAICLVLAPLADPFPAHAPASAWWSVAYLCVMCTGVCFLLQTVGQKYTPPSEVAILLTLESVFGVIISVLFYHERLTLRVAAGFALIFLAVLISETKLSFFHRKRTETTGERN